MNIEQHELPIEAEVVLDEKMDEGSPAIAGLCPSCLNTGFVHSVREGVLGIVCISAGVDTTGKAKRSLLRCECKIDTNGI
jgi:hypothetical protein